LAEQTPTPQGAPAEGPREYSIDALAAATGVPSRTIRFYQSKGALQKPEIRGRKAVYTDAHVERLELIGQLQDRGLRIRAIRDLVGRFDRGELVLSEWLGLQDSLVAPWVEEGPRLMDEEGLRRLTGPLAPGRLAELVRLGFVERKGGQLLCPSVPLLQTALQLEAAGIALEVSGGAIDRARKHTGKLARDLAQLFESHAGEGFGGEAAATRAALEAWRAHGPGVVSGVFAEQMQAVLIDLVARGKGGRLQG